MPPDSTAVHDLVRLIAEWVVEDYAAELAADDDTPRQDFIGHEREAGVEP